MAEEITILTTDPKGWEEQSVSFARTNDFGLNAEFTVPFQFSGDGRKKLKQIFDKQGIFSNASVRISKRSNDWSVAEFYTYKLDFTTYKDDQEFISIEGLEDGLNSKFDANADTEYELDLAVENYDRETLLFSGSSNVDQNMIVANVGQMQPKDRYGDGIFPLLGNRAIRTYSDSLSFTENDGSPYKQMTFNATQNIASLPLHIKVYCKIFTSRNIFGIPTWGQGRVRLIRYNADWSTRTVLWTSNLIDGIPFALGRNFYFDQEIDVTISMSSGEHVALCFDVASWVRFDYASYPSINEPPRSDTYISIKTLTNSAYLDQPLQVFSHENMIRKLLARIDSTAVLDYKLTHNTNMPMLCPQTAFLQIGTDTPVGKFKAKLSDVLKSLNVLEVIGIDITGNKMTIDYLENFYDKTPTPIALNSNDVIVEYDLKNTFNKFKVGFKSNNLIENGRYAFNCERSYSISNSTVDKELDLTHPFIGDMYTIEQMLNNDSASTSGTGTSTTRETDNQMIVFSCYGGVENNNYVYRLEKSDRTPVYTFIGDKASAYNVRFSPRRILEKWKRYIGISNLKNALNIEYDSSDIESDFESSVDGNRLNEKQGLQIQSNNVIFGNFTLSFETEVDYDTLNTVKANKYLPYAITSKGITYNGFINTAAFAIGQNQKQQWKLQGYDI